MITATEVPEEERPGFTSRHFGSHALVTEINVYTTMSWLAREYKGAYWHFYTLSNGGFYVAPDLEERTLLVEVQTNGYRGTMSTDAAGIVTTLFVLNRLAFDTEAEEKRQRLIKAFDALHCYALEHDESTAILGAID